MTREKELFERIRELEERNKGLERKLGMYDRIMFGGLRDENVTNKNINSLIRHQLLTICVRGWPCDDNTHQISILDIAKWTMHSSLTVGNGINRLHENGHISFVGGRGKGNAPSVYRINL